LPRKHKLFLWEVTRVIPPAALTGQAAGLARQHGTTPEQLAASTLQEELTRLGVPFHLADLHGAGEAAASKTMKDSCLSPC